MKHVSENENALTQSFSKEDHPLSKSGFESSASNSAAAPPFQLLSTPRASAGKAGVIQREPIKGQAGTIDEFIGVFDNTPSKMGQSSGQAAHDNMIRLGATKWSWDRFMPLPTTTPYFNNRDGRYVYTNKGGWIDMVHFLFYAGKAYAYKVKKDAAIKKRESTEKRMREACKNGGCYWPPVVPKSSAESIDPHGEAMQDGYQQEFVDQVAAPHSAYSYEDLPSDNFGAIFATQHFHPLQDGGTFSSLLKKYFIDELGATKPSKAPNFDNLPTDAPTDAPTKTNKTTTPVYTN